MSKRTAHFTLLVSILLPFGTTLIASIIGAEYRALVREAREDAEAEFLASRRSLHQEAEQAIREVVGEDSENIAPVIELIAQSEKLWIDQAKAAGEIAAAEKRSALAWTPVAYSYYASNVIFFGGIFLSLCGVGAMGCRFEHELKTMKASSS